MEAHSAERVVWIGLVEVAPHDSNDIFEGGLGAFSNVLALATSVEDYMAVTAAALDAEGLTAVAVDDPEPLSERQSRGDLPTDILELGEQAAAGDVVWGTFHIFETDEE
jgi:hypothetical protein